MATTTNYSWTTPDDTSLVKDGAAAIRTLGSSIDTTTKNLNPQTTTGAIAYRSATSNVNTALPIGTAGQVLIVNSGATAPEWGTVAGGGMTVIASGSLSGATVDLTSIPATYNDLRVVLRGFSNDDDAGYITSRVNATASIYANGNTFSTTGSSIISSNIELMAGIAMDSDIGNPGSSLIYDIYDYASTTSLKQFRSRITYFNTSGTRNLYMLEGAIRLQDAINAIRLSLSSGNFDSGTYILYGVK